MYMTNIPYGLPSNVYRSMMPSNVNDAKSADLKAKNIGLVVVLCSEEECKKNCSGDLKKFYEDAGCRVKIFPIQDFSVPEKEQFSDLIATIICESHQGTNILVHCRAGMGRTGTVLSCLAKRVFNISGKEAVAWVRKYVAGAVETGEQNNVVKAYYPRNEEESKTEWPKPHSYSADRYRAGDKPSYTGHDKIYRNRDPLPPVRSSVHDNSQESRSTALVPYMPPVTVPPPPAAKSAPISTYPGTQPLDKPVQPQIPTPPVELHGPISGEPKEEETSYLSNIKNMAKNVFTYFHG